MSSQSGEVSSLTNDEAEEIPLASGPSEREDSVNELPDAVPRSERELELCQKLQRLEDSAQELLSEYDRLNAVQNSLTGASATASCITETETWVSNVLRVLQQHCDAITDRQYLSTYMLRRVARILDSFHLLVSQQQACITPGSSVLPHFTANAKSTSEEPTHATRHVEVESDADSPPEASGASLGQGMDSNPASVPTGTVIEEHASMSLSSDILALAGRRMAFAMLPVTQDFVDRHGIWVLLTAVVKYTNSMLQPKGGEAAVLHSLSNIGMLRSLSMALCLLYMRTTQQDSAPLSQSVLDSSLRLLCGFPVVPGHAGIPLDVTALLKASPLLKTTQKYTLSNWRAKKQLRGMADAQPDVPPTPMPGLDPDTGAGQKALPASKHIAVSSSNYDIAPRLDRLIQDHDNFLDRFTRLALPVATAEREPEWAPGEALALVFHGLQLVSTWTVQLTSFCCFKKFTNDADAPGKTCGYSEADLDGMLEILSSVEEVRHLLEKEQTWLTPLVNKGIAQQLCHFLSKTIPELQSEGLPEKAKLVFTGIQAAFQSWTSAACAWPDRANRSQSVVQSLTDLTLLLRKTGSKSMSEMPILAPLPRKEKEGPLHVASETLRSGVSKMRMSLKAGLRASAKATFGGALPALPPPPLEASFQDILPQSWQSLMPITPEQIHLLWYTVEDLLHDQDQSRNSRIFLRKERLSTHAIRELDKFLASLAQWENAAWMDAVKEAADVSGIWLLESLKPTGSVHSDCFTLPHLLADVALRPSSNAAAEVCLMPAAVYRDGHARALQEKVTVLEEASIAAGKAWYEGVVKTACKQVFDTYRHKASDELGSRWTNRAQAISPSASAARFEVLLETKTVALPCGEQPFQQHVMVGLSDLFLKSMQGLLDQLQVTGASGLPHLERQLLCLRHSHELLSSSITLRDFASMWVAADAPGGITIPTLLSEPGSRLATCVLRNLVDIVIPSSSYCHTMQRLVQSSPCMLAGSEQAQDPAELVASQPNGANAAADVGVAHIGAFLRIFGVQEGAAVLAMGLQKHLLILLTGEVSAGLCQLESEIPSRLLQRVASATGLHASKQDLLSASLVHFDQVLTAGGLLRLSSALREVGCSLALLQILDIATGLEASKAAMFAVPLFQALNDSHSATAMQARLAAESAMTPMTPSKDVLQQLKVFMDERGDAMPRDTLTQVLSLVLLATCLRAAGKAGGSSDDITTDPLLWGVSGIVSLTDTGVSFSLHDIVHRISQLQMICRPDGKKAKDILASLTAKSQDAQATLDAAMKVYQDGLTSCSRYTWEGDSPLMPESLSLCH